MAVPDDILALQELERAMTRMQTLFAIRDLTRKYCKSRNRDFTTAIEEVVSVVAHSVFDDDDPYWHSYLLESARILADAVRIVEDAGQ